MGDLLKLAAFSHVPVLSDLMVGCFTTQSEALEAVRIQRPNLLFVTEDLEQGYGILLISEVERLDPETQCILFLKRETEPVVHEALEARGRWCGSDQLTQQGHQWGPDEVPPPDCGRGHRRPTGRQFSSDLTHC